MNKATGEVPISIASGTPSTLSDDGGNQPFFVGRILHRNQVFRSWRCDLLWSLKITPKQRIIPFLLARPVRIAMPLEDRLNLLLRVKKHLQTDSIFADREAAIPPIQADDLKRKAYREASLLPTPVACDHMPVSFMTGYRKLMGLGRAKGTFIGFSLKWHPAVLRDKLRLGGELNPDWIEWLMGYPPGWTQLNGSA